MSLIQLVENAHVPEVRGEGPTLYLDIRTSPQLFFPWLMYDLPQIRILLFGLLSVFPGGVFFHFRVTGACSVSTYMIIWRKHMM